MDKMAGVMTASEHFLFVIFIQTALISTSSCETRSTPDMLGHGQHISKGFDYKAVLVFIPAICVLLLIACLCWRHCKASNNRRPRPRGNVPRSRSNGSSATSNLQEGQDFSSIYTINITPPAYEDIYKGSSFDNPPSYDDVIRESIELSQMENT